MGDPGDRSTAIKISAFNPQKRGDFWEPQRWIILASGASHLLAISCTARFRPVCRLSAVDRNWLKLVQIDANDPYVWTGIGWAFGKRMTNI